ncbi:MAG: radical SAM protein [Candidatus Bathyarchaeia archaeon]
MPTIVDLLEYKRKILGDLGNNLENESRRRASEDYHSKRRPRPCGMTIHTGIGCGFSCMYCYIYDMGFSAMAKQYPLEPKELVYALTLNPYVIPERTLAAYGSVTEPFQPETAERAIKYMREVWRHLKLPSQVSTKAILTNEITSGMLSSDPNINVLVTVVTLSNRRLEPKAPDPLMRIDSAGRSAEAGLNVSLFIRPIIPSVTDAEANRILSLAAYKGMESVTLGSLRVTKRILYNLERCGVTRGEIERRLLKPLKGNKQIEIRSQDLKNKIRRVAEDLRLKVFKAACEANMYYHKRYCAICHMGPCNTNIKAERLEDSDIRDLLEYLGAPYSFVEVDDESIKIGLKGAQADGYIRYLMTMGTYRRTVFLKE